MDVRHWPELHYRDMLAGVHPRSRQKSDLLPRETAPSARWMSSATGNDMLDTAKAVRIKTKNYRRVGEERDRISDEFVSIHEGV